jgi:hypothetical protein
MRVLSMDVLFTSVRREVGKTLMERSPVSDGRDASPPTHLLVLRAQRRDAERIFIQEKVAFPST